MSGGTHTPTSPRTSIAHLVAAAEHLERWDHHDSKTGSPTDDSTTTTAGKRRAVAGSGSVSAAGSRRASRSSSPDRNDGAGDGENSSSNGNGNGNGTTTGGRKKKPPPAKRKVTHACIFCRRSHMTCDDHRPCKRCIKRKIGHLCRNDEKSGGGGGGGAGGANSGAVDAHRGIGSEDEHTQSLDVGTGYTGEVVDVGPSPRTYLDMADLGAAAGVVPMSSILNPAHANSSNSSAANDIVNLPSTQVLNANMASALVNIDAISHHQQQQHLPHQHTAPTHLPSYAAYDNGFAHAGMSGFPHVFASASMGNEFAVLSDFLSSWDGTLDGINQQQTLGVGYEALEGLVQEPQDGALTTDPALPQPPPTTTTTTGRKYSDTSLNGTKLSSAERFILTAADPNDGPNEDRLHSIILAKIDAGLLKPYNYINGYTRLQKWMDTHMSAPSRQRILHVLGMFRPRFRQVAQSLTDYDLVMVEEAFERLLLEYDRVFSAMGIPACLWRRTGEIYKANKEFANLVGLEGGELRDGKVKLYELMDEDSAVNYWEKYGNIAFDAGQKAVLTSCVLLPRKGSKSITVGGTPTTTTGEPQETRGEHCCFSFTIRRDKYNIPLLIAGNFLVVRSNSATTPAAQ
ncbi:uncharacterized protein EV422DRAFT_566784 [Fimicolochytrium jonesii]|uniref:uncharacterized protein n=1 Tax=Fimicolochytrium jonesii TaxID=1396493 RepID=UPI0022FEBA8D|nr:uncharacterized protein EV422DRAFT_566784 [Fimicolochytrium jonesii]KAI8821704.1 hypothetical protein EV422DRAFT_566784 [Fimicolochytrium jonesii]